MAKKSPDRVRINLKYEFKDKALKNRYLAQIFRNGLFIDDKKIAKLKGQELAEYLILSAAQTLDPEYMQEPPESAVEVKPDEKPAERVGATKSAKVEKPAPAQEEVSEKISSLGLKDVLFR